MISKSNKFIKHASIAALAIVALAASLSSNNINLSKNILRGSAVEVSSATIVFDGSTATPSGTTNTTIGRTSTGGTIICKTFDNDSTQSSGYVGAVKKGSIIKFYEADGVTEYTFEHLVKIQFNKVGTSTYLGFNLDVLYADGSIPESPLSYSSKTNSTRTIDFTTYGSVSNIGVNITNSYSSVAQLTSIVITYDCVSKYQDGVSILSNPSQTVYAPGEAFDPTGMIVARHYSNNSTVATNSFTYEPTGTLTASDDHITIYSGGFSTTVAVTVSSQGLSGTYSGTYTSIEFTSNSSGKYIYGSEILYFTYVLSGSSIIFTYASGDNTSFGSYRLFEGGSSPKANSTGSITGENTISVKTYNMFDSATARTFTKA